MNKINFEILEKNKPPGKILELVRKLGYPVNVARGLVQIVYDWKDEEGNPSIEVWQNELGSKRQEYRQGRITKEGLIQTEINLIKKFSLRIREGFTSNEEERFFDLAEAVRYKQAQCLSYTILVYILGNAIGFMVDVIGVTEIVLDGKLPVGSGHIACLFSLSDDRMMMVDLAVGPILSQPFKLEDTYALKGYYWEIKDDNNPLLLNRRFTLLNLNGIIATIHVNRGKMSPPKSAIVHYNYALALNPKYVDAYSNKGVALEELGQLGEAITCYNRALEINPKDAKSHFNRGCTHMKMGWYEKAISDYSMAIKHHYDFPEAYFNRGTIYKNLGQYDKALSDYGKAIELNPEYALAYFYRGNTYIDLGELPEALSDFNSAIEINPDFPDAYFNRGIIYAEIGALSKAVEDLNLAKELDPGLKDRVEKLI